MISGSCEQVTFRGDGILGGIQAIAGATGVVKGKIGNPEADPPLKQNGKLDVGAAVGAGTLLKLCLLRIGHRFPGLVLTCLKQPLLTVPQAVDTCGRRIRRKGCR